MPSRLVTEFAVSIIRNVQIPGFTMVNIYGQRNVGLSPHVRHAFIIGVTEILFKVTFNSTYLLIIDIVIGQKSKIARFYDPIPLNVISMLLH